MDISKQHLIKDIKYFEAEEELQIMLRDGCEEGSGDYKQHQSVLETCIRSRITFENMLRDNYG